MTARIAYHEAGHAVACELLGIGLICVTLRPPEDGSGDLAATRFHDPLAAPNGDYNYSAMADLATVALAGPFAQRRYRPRRWRHGAARDFAEAAELAARMHRTFRLRDGVDCYAEAERRARTLVDEHWKWITAVAQALLERRTLHEVHSLAPGATRQETGAKGAGNTRAAASFSRVRF